jgi:hypothetical protein
MGRATFSIDPAMAAMAQTQAKKVSIEVVYALAEQVDL